MARYIDAEYDIHKLEILCRNTNDDERSAIRWALEEIPTADVQPVIHGHWKGKPVAGYCTVFCSVCGSAFTHNSGNFKFCPNCGAKMDEEVE